MIEGPSLCHVACKNKGAGIVCATQSVVIGIHIDHNHVSANTHGIKLLAAFLLAGRNENSDTFI